MDIKEKIENLVANLHNPLTPLPKEESLDVLTAINQAIYSQCTASLPDAADTSLKDWLFEALMLRFELLYPARLNLKKLTEFSCTHPWLITHQTNSLNQYNQNVYKIFMRKMHGSSTIQACFVDSFLPSLMTAIYLKNTLIWYKDCKALDATMVALDHDLRYVFSWIEVSGSI